MEFFASIILIIVFYCICKVPEWKSNNHVTPNGMKTDWSKASTDITLHGKDYYYRKNAAGGYDIPDPYYNKKNK